MATVNALRLGTDSELCLLNVSPRCPLRISVGSKPAARCQARQHWHASAGAATQPPMLPSSTPASAPSQGCSQKCKCVSCATGSGESPLRACFFSDSDGAVRAPNKRPRTNEQHAVDTRVQCTAGSMQLRRGTAPMQNSATVTRTRVARVRAEYPNQLDYSGPERAAA